MNTLWHIDDSYTPWNKGKLVGQKPPQAGEIWAIRVHLKLANRASDLALFNMAIDSNKGLWFSKVKTPGCCPWRSYCQSRHQHATENSSPCPFEITDMTREVLANWVEIGEVKDCVLTTFVFGLTSNALNVLYGFIEKLLLKRGVFQQNKYIVLFS